MPDYNFETLSPIDFEHLVRDLLQSEFGIRLESFKPGRDDGIDLRYAQDDGCNLIVQAKHFVKSGFNGLLSQLKKVEKGKIEKIIPKRYILATSVPLSPRNKEVIRKLLSPYIHRTNDIFGKDDLNNLLGRFPNIEKQHIKLWLSSYAILHEILHSQVINQTKMALSRFQKKALVYVMNDSFLKASEILKEHNYVIIAGIPGIGKTTLADMLVLHYIREGYEFVDVSSDINEAYSIQELNRHRVILYDDFLGRTSLQEKLNKREENRLFDFISVIRSSKYGKLILTTREYILHQAQESYETLDNPIFDTPQCIIDLSLYTRKIRADILYNHLYYSSLPRDYVAEIVRQAAYLKIIDHPNYNPRIIEYMSDPMWIKPHSPSEYPSIFLNNLQNPFIIWEQAFNHHISDMAQDILLVVSTLPREVFLEDLNSAINQLCFLRSKSFSEKDFLQSIAQLEGSFITIKKSRDKEIIEFHNPSIRDFMETYLRNHTALFVEMANAAIHFEQVEWIVKQTLKNKIFDGIADNFAYAFQRTLNVKPCTLTNYSSGIKGTESYKDRRHLNIAERVSIIILCGPQNKHNSFNIILLEALKGVLEQIKEYKIPNDDLLTLIKRIVKLDFIAADYIDNLLTFSKESLFLNIGWVSDISYTLEFINLFPGLHGDGDRVKLLSAIQSTVESDLGTGDLQLLSNELFDLEKIEAEYDLGIQDQINEFKNEISKLEEELPNTDDEDNHKDNSINDPQESVSDFVLDGMFQTLL